MRRLSDLMGEAWRGMTLVEPQERWHESDGRRIQGWLYEAPRASGRRGKPAPLVVEIHGGPATLYGWSLMWEWQVLVAAGISVYACNPRGSTGYGQAFAAANHRDWGDGPMADIEAGVDAIVAEGRADPQRLGVTGGSYGGYLAAWMIGHTDRYAAAVACRGVYDMTSEMLSGDLGGPNFGRYEFGAQPWEDPELYRQVSPLTLRHRDAHAAAHPARRAGPALPHHPGRGALLRAALAAPPGAAHAHARREPRADAQRLAVPSHREPRAHPRLVRPLPGGRSAYPSPHVMRERRP